MNIRKPNAHGHVTRFSDSSIYDEICTLCGATDAMGDRRLDRRCPRAEISPSVAKTEGHKTMTAALVELLERVRAATGPEKATQERSDFALLFATTITGIRYGLHVSEVDHKIWYGTFRNIEDALGGSIDAAVALVERCLSKADVGPLVRDEALRDMHKPWRTLPMSAFLPLAILAALLCALIAEDTKP